ncbi:MAG: type IV pilus modification PilV family protein [Desulfobulbales bacterium]
MKTKATLQNRDGFTLIEVLVAITIMAIGILTVITMQLTSIKGNLKSSNISVASNWAADRIERIFAMDYVDLTDTNPPNGAAGLDEVTDASADGKAVSPDGFFTIYWNVAEDLMMPNTKTVRIIVLRQDMGVTKTVTMDYLKAQYM